jgi:hypothetical protein
MNDDCNVVNEVAIVMLLITATATTSSLGLSSLFSGSFYGEVTFVISLVKFAYVAQ